MRVVMTIIDIGISNIWTIFHHCNNYVGNKFDLVGVVILNNNWDNFFSQHDGDQIFPELIFIKNDGVFIAPSFNLAKTAQLRCFYDVISRVSNEAALDPLNELEIAELLNWDAEKLRQKMSV